MGNPNPTSNYKEENQYSVGNLQIAAYMFAGLAMMLNIRLSYSAAPFALLRFKLPENLFSVFVRTTSSALELWCIPSMLIGNIMEQFYNHTQINPSSHTTGINDNKSQIQSKAGELKVTAGTQSTSELTGSRDTDLIITSNFPENKLTGKAGELKQKAEALSTKAKELESAATSGSTLHPLSGPAGALKDAAKKDDGTGLHHDAEELSKKKASQDDAKAQADKVINAFDEVEQKYDELMNAAKKHNLTYDSKVTDVVKAYHSVKNIYYQILIGYRFRYLIGEGSSDGKILNKASLLYTQAKGLADAEKLQSKPNQADAQKEKLKELATTLGKAVGENIVSEGLQKALNELKSAQEDTQIVTKALDVIINYKKVKDAYDAVKAKEKEYQTHADDEYTQVKDAFTDLEEKFNVLQKSYENVLRLRVQELSNLAQKLNGAASKVTDLELRDPAGALATAAMGSTDGLKQKAEALVQAINGIGQVDTPAKAVITQFETVRDKYNALANKPEYKQKISESDENVQKVETAYNNLKEVYDKILNFAKIKHYSTQVENAANTGDPNKVITNFNAVVTVYNQLDPYSQSIVQSNFDYLQKEYSEAIYKYKFHILTIPSIITNWLNFLTFVILLIVFVTGGDNGHVTGYYVIMAISGFVFGINMVLVYAVDYRYLPFYMAGENSFPMVTSLILYFATSIFGNRRKYNSDYLVVVIDVSIAILIALVASVLWTVAFFNYRAALGGELTPIWPSLISPIAMVIVGMGLVYSIYPGIAPGMIVPFYLIDKIEMVLLVATAFPPVIIAFLRKYAENWSPSTKFLFSNFNMGGWQTYTDNDGKTSVHGWIWHFFDILIPLKVSLAVVFVYSLHYRDSNISRAIVNQPKMSTFLTIVFYMCHEILLALGFPGMVGNGGAGGKVMLPVQYVGALLMVFLAFYSIGYITEYKRHDPSQWPTEGMTKWNAMCYWLKMASKITNKNFKQLFTTDLRRDQVLCIKRKYNVVVCIMNICGIY